MSCYVNLCGEQAVFFYFMFREFVGNSYTPKDRAMQRNFKERPRATLQFCEAQARQ